MDKYRDAFEKAHEFEFAEFRFDEPDYKALMVTEENYLEMLRVQAPGIAYYGTLAKNAEAEYNELERRYKARYAEMFDVCGSTIRKTGQKDSQKSIESLMNTKYEKELEEWHVKLDELRARRDGTANYFDAWKAKGFALSSMTQLIASGLLSMRDGITEDDISRIEQRRMNVAQANGILSNHKRLMNSN